MHWNVPYDVTMQVKLGQWNHKYVGVGVEGCEDVVSLCLNGSSRGILVVLVPSLSLNPENDAVDVEDGVSGVGVEDGVSGVGVEDGEALGLGGSLGKQGG